MPRYGIDTLGACLSPCSFNTAASTRPPSSSTAPSSPSGPRRGPARSRCSTGALARSSDGDPTEIKLTINSWLDLLSESVPPDVYQPACLNTVYDSHCTLSKSANSISGICGPGATVTAVPTNISAAADYYTLGSITFTSGANNGDSRTVKSQDGSGNLAFALPLLAAPANGDTFTIAAGCDRQMATCDSKFSNLINFRGQPFVPGASDSLLRVTAMAEDGNAQARDSEKALSWASPRTPYHHAARLKGIGADCATFPLETFATTGVIPPTDVGPDSPDGTSTTARILISARAGSRAPDRPGAGYCGGRRRTPKPGRLRRLEVGGAPIATGPS